MSKNTGTQAADFTAPAQQASAATKSQTAWDVFAKAQLIPAEVRCQSWTPSGDESCHTRLTNALQVANHITAGHGGRFQIYLRKTDGESSKFWDAMSNAGVEAHGFNCAICGKEVRFTLSSITQHLKSHRGSQRQNWAEMVRDNPKSTGKFYLVLGFGQAPEVEADDEADF